MNKQVLIDKLNARTQIDPISGCWIWQGCLVHEYGQIKIEGQRHRVHRLAYKTLVDPNVPGNLVIDHVAARGCTSKACWNPDHLEAVTQRENVRRGNSPVASFVDGVTHCKHGHPYEEEPAAGAKRRCEACRRSKKTCPECGRQVGYVHFSRHVKGHHKEADHE